MTLSFSYFCGLFLQPDVLVFHFEAFAVGGHRLAAHAHARETAVVEQVLHRYLTRQVREKRQHVAGTVVGRSVAQRGNAFCVVEQVFHAQYALAGRGRGRRY